VYWGAYWSGAGAAERTSYDQAWNAVGNDPAFYARLAEYSTRTLTIQTGAWTGSTVANTSLASGALVTEAQIQQELAAEIAAGTAPARTDNNIYVIMIPPGVTSQLDSENNFAGHHGQFLDSHSQPIRYAVITYSTDKDYSDPVISHEISEAITDPDLSNGWFDTSGSEVGDLCRFSYAQLDGVQIEEIFSQRLCQCIAVLPPSTDAGTDSSTDSSTDSGKTPNACTAAAWNASSAYPGGSVVSFNGNQYTAAYWNQGMEPDLHNGPAGSGQQWLPPVSCQPTSCVPACSGKQCGSDGCGGVCGTCASGQTCSASNQCVGSCVPACSGKQCGSDGCGGVCGTCASGQTCSASNQCVSSCVPACSGKQCGSDGCGGVCGTCASGQTCTSAGLCQASPPPPPVGCGRLSPWDPNKPWYDYQVGEEHTGSNNHRYVCKSVGYCIYDPTSQNGSFGWTDAGPC
jgi:hypothetical protein